jgi:hypothetical protein
MHYKRFVCERHYRKLQESRMRENRMYGLTRGLGRKYYPSRSTLLADATGYRGTTVGAKLKSTMLWLGPNKGATKFKWVYRTSRWPPWKFGNVLGCWLL